MARVLVLGVKVPFTTGGQEVLVRTLQTELEHRGHEADIVELPLSSARKESLLHQCAIWRAIDLSEFGGKQVDLVISTKFPSYYVSHPKKSLWLVHQHRPLYDLYASRFSDISDDPRDEQLRQMLVEGDKQVIGECAYTSGISKNVVARLGEFNGIEAEVLYPPLPLGARYRSSEPENYLLSVGRLCAIKRVDFLIKALPIIHDSMKLKIVGRPDEPGFEEYLHNEIDKHHLWNRVQFLGRVSDEELIDLYAKAYAVYYAPHNEDYGYVTLEGMASGKALITATDSGGTLEFIEHNENGIVVEPSIDAIGHGVNDLIDHPEKCKRLGQHGRSFVEQSGLFEHGWDAVVEKLLSPLGEES